MRIAGDENRMRIPPIAASQPASDPHPQRTSSPVILILVLSYRDMRCVHPPASWPPAMPLVHLIRGLHGAGIFNRAGGGRRGIAEYEDC